MVVATQHKVRTRTYKQEIDFNVGMLAKDSWAREMLGGLAVKASKHPLPTSEISGLGHTFNLAVEHPECLELINLRCNQVGRDEVRLLFQRLESRIQTHTAWTAQTRERYFAHFRASVLRATRELAFPEKITTDSLRYRKTLSGKTKPRKLISDYVDDSDDAINEKEPLAAISHETVVDLYAKTQAKVEFDLGRIIDACVSELRLWASIREKVRELSKIPPTTTERKILNNLLKKDGRFSQWSFDRANEQFSPERRIGLYAQVAHERGMAKSAIGSGVQFPALKEALLKAFKVDEKLLKGEPTRRVVIAPYRMLSLELIAVFVLLLCHTGWNSHSLVHMPATMIKEDGRNVDVLSGKIEIQGFKSKTDDDTPTVFLDNTHRYAVEAINLTLWNLRQLKSLGLVDPEEQRLWFTFTFRETAKMTEQYIGFQNALNTLIQKHGLPKFSLDQIRAQVLVAQQLRFRNLETTRRVAGHASISTTGRYLEQEIFERINSSISLEFQRRLEATAHFRISEIGDCVVPKYDKTRIDIELLVPIGDGASCADPTHPPLEEYLDSGICAAQRCHAEEGCPNRRIIIDASRLEEIVRKRIYYSRNWKRLLENNPELFKAHHFANMMFNISIYDYVKNSLYSSLLKKIEGRLEASLGKKGL